MVQDAPHDFEALFWAMGIDALHHTIMWEFYYRELTDIGNPISRWEFWLRSARQTFDTHQPCQ